MAPEEFSSRLLEARIDLATHDALKPIVRERAAAGASYAWTIWYLPPLPVALQKRSSKSPGIQQIGPATNLSPIPALRMRYWMTMI